MADFPEHPFWDFSLSVYSSEGVGAACLQLQSAHQLDVNVLLYCLWLGASGHGAITDGETRTVLDAVDNWHHDVVRALRAVRTRMKGGMPPAPDALAESLRQRIQKIEIDCEHAEQLMLAAALDRPADDTRNADARLSDAVANICRYFNALDRRPGDDDRASLVTVVAAAFDGVEAGAIASRVRSM